MVFSSITFILCFLPITLILYYAAPASCKNAVLLVMSLIFYAWGEPVYVLLMAFSIAANYAFGRMMSWKRKCALISAVSVNLLVLGFFKYADFVTGTIGALIGTEIAPLDLPLPIGISFYTFQAMSYIIDVYRGTVSAKKNVIDFAMYICMFPQLIAGPIVRLSSIEGSLHTRTVSIEDIAIGVRRFVIGLGKKAILANSAGMIWDSVCAEGFNSISPLTAWLGIIAFTFQIYFDFSGYSDMAIGLGKMLGFDFPENFRYPYMSLSVTEFWRRWHISLGTWFREYLYIPLGGNRRGFKRQLLNIFIVWFLTGLWHGASWNFVIWGLYFAVILVLEKAFLLKFGDKLDAALGNRISHLLRHIYTIFLVVMSWAIFSIEELPEFCTFITALFGGGRGQFADSFGLYLLNGNLNMFLVFFFGATDWPKRAAEKLFADANRSTVKKIFEAVFTAIVLIISISYITAGTYNPFLYFRF